VALLAGGLVRPRLLHRRRGIFGFVAEAAFAFGDVGQFLRVLLQRVDTPAVVDHFLAFVEQFLEVHLDPLLGAPVTRS
jgi:hypothetical protein